METTAFEQELTFNAVKKSFAEHKTPFNNDKYKSLGICRLNDEIYTNLGWIIFDQCEYSTKDAEKKITLK